MTIIDSECFEATEVVVALGETKARLYTLKKTLQYPQIKEEAVKLNIFREFTSEQADEIVKQFSGPSLNTNRGPIHYSYIPIESGPETDHCFDVWHSSQGSSVEKTDTEMDQKSNWPSDKSIAFLFLA
jgi:hypothetical protein